MRGEGESLPESQLVFCSCCICNEFLPWGTLGCELVGMASISMKTPQPGLASLSLLSSSVHVKSVSHYTAMTHARTVLLRKTHLFLSLICRRIQNLGELEWLSFCTSHVSLLNILDNSASRRVLAWLTIFSHIHCMEFHTFSPTNQCCGFCLGLHVDNGFCGHFSHFLH